MKYYPMLIACLLAFSSQAQTSTPPPQVYQFVEKMPSCPYDLGQYLSENIHYPDAAIAKGIEGRVLIKFVINEDGAISDVTLSKGIGGGCDEEALRVVKNMPKWAPGSNDGKSVKVFFTQPIRFRLPEPDTALQSAEIYSSVDIMPKPSFDIQDYLAKNLRYPSDAREKGIEGKVIVRFVVTANGAIRRVEVVKSAGAILDKEAVRIVSQMPAWAPGIKDGKPVNCYFHQPIGFKLDR